MAFHRFLMVFMLFVVLVGCGTRTTNNTTPIATQFSQPASEFENGLESSLTITPRPSSASSPDVTPHQTQTVFDEAIYYATQSVVQTKVAQFPRVCKENYSRPNFSPNDLWMEELCYSESDHDLVLTLSNRQTQVLWKLLYQDYIPQMDFVPDGGMSIIHWSKDERYAYFYSFLGGDGADCFYRYDHRGSGLFRLDLQSGQTTPVLSPSNDWWYSFSFSPTNRRLLYGVRAKDLKILDLTTGEIINIPSKNANYETGGYLWSSDGTKLIYTVLVYGEQWERENYSLRLFDVLSGDEQILLEAPDKCFYALAWKITGVLTFERHGREGQAVIEYDLNSNIVISESTATPFP